MVLKIITETVVASALGGQLSPGVWFKSAWQIVDGGGGRSLFLKTLSNILIFFFFMLVICALAHLDILG